MNDKIILRKQFKSLRAGFKGAERERADEAVLETFLNRFAGFESYFIYNSFSSEADTKRIISALLKADKRVFLPRTEGENMVAVPYGQTKPGAFGIEEPEGQAYFGEIDVAVIPLLAVNNDLCRIGYGKGYYDKFLKDRHTLKIGLGYSFQRTEFQGDEWDIPLDIFLCEKGVYGK